MERRPVCTAIVERPCLSYRSNRNLAVDTILRQHGVPERKMLSWPSNHHGPEEL
jgi:hypothetical protein